MLENELCTGGGWFSSDTSPSMLAFCTVDALELDTGAAEPRIPANELSPPPEVIALPTPTIALPGPVILMPGAKSGPTGQKIQHYIILKAGFIKYYSTNLLKSIQYMDTLIFIIKITIYMMKVLMKYLYDESADEI